MSSLDDIQEAINKVMGEDPIEMVKNYYEGLIRLSKDRIAEEQKMINKMQQRIEELATHTKLPQSGKEKK